MARAKKAVAASTNGMDLLKAASGGMQKATPQSKKGMRVVECPEALRSATSELCLWGYLAQEATEIAKDEKLHVADHLRLMWANDLVKDGKKPENFKVLVPKTGDGPDESLCAFEMVFRKDTLQTTLNDLPEGRDFVEFLVERLIAEGLSAKAAREFIAKELKVYDAYLLVKTFDELVSDEKLGPIAQKMLAALTVEERALVVKRKPTVSIKEGMAERLLTYCKTAEQAAGLLKLLCTQTKIAKFEYLMSEDAQKRMAVIGQIISEHCLPQPVQSE